MPLEADFIQRLFEEAHGLTLPRERAEALAPLASSMNDAVRDAATSLAFEGEATSFRAELERADD